MTNGRKPGSGNEVKLIQHIFGNPDEFQRLIKSNYDLLETAKQFPNHAEELIVRVLSNPDEFQRLIKSNYDLLETAKQFPNHAEELIVRVLSNPDEFQRLIKHSLDLEEIAKHFPNHAEELIVRVLSNPDEFQRLIKHSLDLEEIAKHFPNHAEELIVRVLSKPDEFQRVIKHSLALVETAKQFPNHAEELIVRVLSNPDEFQRLIKNSYDLRQTAEQFPNHSEILGKSSVDEALEAIRERHANAMKEQAKNKSRDHGRQAIEKILYFDLAYSARSYSDKPTHTIEPSRLIAGLPAFVKEKDCFKRVFKKLVIPGCDISKWDEDKKVSARLRIKSLKKLGFNVYFYDSKKLVSFDINCFENGEFEQDSALHPSEARLAEKLGIPANEISLINESSLDLLIAGDNSDWQAFSPFKRIILRDHPISAQSFEALIHAHGHKIETLEIGNCPNITSLPDDLRTKINHLVDLRINYNPYAKEFLQSIVLQLPKLDRLALYGYSFKDSFMEKVEFSNLSSLTLQDSSVSSDQLGSILQKSPVIKHLEINQCFNLGSQHLCELKLTGFESLVLKSSNINIAFLQMLFISAPNLKRIYVYSCYNLDAGDLDNLVFENLEELHIENCNFTDASIEALRNSAKNDANVTIIKLPVQEKKLPITKPTAKTNKRREGGIKITLDNFEVDHIHPIERSHKAGMLSRGAGLDVGRDASRIDVSEHFQMVTHAGQVERAHTDHPPLDSTTGKLEYTAVHADTTLEKSETLKAERKFIGKPRSPALRHIRLAPYNQFTLNKNKHAIKYPFLLSHTLTNLSSQPELKNLKCSVSLYDHFNQKGEDTYFGRYDMLLSTNWQPMPSVSPHETLVAFYINPSDDVDIIKSPDDGFYYIRLKKSFGQLKHRVETLVHYKKEPSHSLNQLPREIKEIVNHCRSFREEPLEKNDDWTATDYLNGVIKQRTGGCLHRSIAFKYLMDQQFPSIPVQIIHNDVHSYVEVNVHGSWISCDLGGYPANIEEDRSVLSEQADDEFNLPDFEPADDVYSIPISDRGRLLPQGYLDKTKNLVNLKLTEIEYFPNGDHFENLSKLEVTGSNITAAKLNNFLDKTPELKTLKIVNCKLTPDEFIKIDFSMLSQIEHISLIGDFVSDAAGLNCVMSTAITNPKWVIESNLLDEDEFASQLPSKLQNQIHLKKPDKKIPTGRYFGNTVKSELQTIVGGDWKKALIQCDDTHAFRLFIQRHFQSTHKPCYYIDSPTELQCVSPYIKREGLIGHIKNGPGGPLYDFISQHQDAFLIVNYDNFKADDIARFNSLLDDERFVDNVAIPERFKIIGLINPQMPDSYQGSDLYSRFDERFDINTSLMTPPDSSISSASQKIAGKHKTIELNGGGDWQARLIGSWLLKGQQLIFREGQLIAAIKDGCTSIELNNPPINDPEFDRFLADMKLHQGIFHQGRLEIKLPQDFNLSLVHKMCFADKDNYLIFSDDRYINPESYVLNEITLSDFLGCYECENTKKGLILKPGYIEQFGNKTISIYLTGTLSPYAWLSLIEKAREQQVQLKVSLAPNVGLPQDLSPEQCVPEVKLKTQAHTHFQISEEPHLLRYPEQALVIDISELEASDLLTSINGKFDEDKLQFQFTEKPSFLLNALSENKTVVLKGTWPNELARALEPLIAKRLASNSCRGELWLVSDDKKTFSLMSESTDKLPAKIADKPIHLEAEFENRFDIVNGVLCQKPFVFLAGGTGIGKTHFITSTWQKKHPACHYGLDQLSSWISDTRAGFKTLFIDEANITSRQWSELEGLFNDPPAIFHNNQYYELSKDHKVIFAGNPLSYGGERQKPAFFEHHQCEVCFKPLPREFIAKLLALDAKSAQPILDVYDYISHLDPNDTLITPREVIMAANLTLAAIENGVSSLTTDIAQTFAFGLCQNFVPKQHKQKFLEMFKPSHASIIENITLRSLIINDTNRPAIEALIHQLNLRQRRLLASPHIPAVGGLGGIVLEGDPGLGKSTLVSEVLVANHMKEDVDFYRIPASYGHDEKQTILLKAFHEGKIVIIDEINSSPMIERLLNALLEGHDLDGKLADQQGFMLIGTQNPITFKGRRQTTLPLLHRLQTVVMESYTTTEQREILRHLGLPPHIMVNMIAEFEQQQNKQGDLCFRDLLKCAKQWVKHQSHQEKIEYKLTPRQQVGEICKLVSIANIENYYAKQLGFTPIPLNAAKTGNLSIRHLAKKVGSAQGEVLEFSRWNEIVTNMGYKTEIISFKDDINLFTQTIIESLKNGDLPMLAFSVDKETGHPDPDPFEAEAREHAAVITSYDPTTDKITLAHWGRTYDVDLAALYFSSQALVSTRKPEFYNKNYGYTQENKLTTPKYLSGKGKGEKKSIIPQENSGFQAKLLITKRPVSKEDLLERRQSQWRQYVNYQSGSDLAFFCKKDKQEPSVHSEDIKKPKQLT